MLLIICTKQIITDHFHNSEDSRWPVNGANSCKPCSHVIMKPPSSRGKHRYYFFFFSFNFLWPLPLGASYYLAERGVPNLQFPTQSPGYGGCGQAPSHPASTLLQVSGVRSTSVSLLPSPEMNNLNHTRAGNVGLELRPHQSLPASPSACALCIKVRRDRRAFR